MCHDSCIRFGENRILREDIQGKHIIEVGSYNTNGSLRRIVEAYAPESYIGVDLQMGPGVNQICDATKLVKTFGPNRFDYLISTELLEHVADWQKVISNFKNVLKPAGKLLITTRSKGFPYHEYPFDYWRYDIRDMKQIFADFMIKVLKKDPDPQSPGVFLIAKKPRQFREVDLSDYHLYRMKKS